MKTKLLFLFTILSLFVLTTHSQVITSDKSSIYINNKLKGNIDQTPPSITLISPKIEQEANLVMNKNALNIIGKASAINGINSIYINQGKIKTPDDGIFTAEISLKPGKNDISIILIDSIYQFVEKNFTIIHNPEIIPVDTVVTDADNLFRTLIDNYSFRKNNVGFMKNPTKTELIEALDGQIDNVTKSDNLLIFYSDHGWWDKETWKINPQYGEILSTYNEGRDFIYKRIILNSNTKNKYA